MINPRPPKAIKGHKEEMFFNSGYSQGYVDGMEHFEKLYLHLRKKALEAYEWNYAGDKKYLESDFRKWLNHLAKARPSGSYPMPG